MTLPTFHKLYFHLIDLLLKIRHWDDHVKYSLFWYSISLSAAGFHIIEKYSVRQKIKDNHIEQIKQYSAIRIEGKVKTYPTRLLEVLQAYIGQTATKNLLMKGAEHL